MKPRRLVLVSAIVAGLGVAILANAGLNGSPAAGGRPATTAEARTIVKAYASSPLGEVNQVPRANYCFVGIRVSKLAPSWANRQAGAHPCSGSHLPARLRSACTRCCDSQRSRPMGARRRRTLRRRMRRGTKTRTRRPPSELRTWHRFGGTGTVQFTSSAWNQEVNQVRLRSLLLFRGERAAVSAQAANRVHHGARHQIE